MFNFFRKKGKINKEDYRFLESVVNKLPSKYSFLIDQVSDEFILDKTPNPLGDAGTYTLTLNANLESKYSDSSFPQFFIIKDIGIWNKNKSQYEQIELHILEGMLAGFRVKSGYQDLDFDRIDISNIKEKQFKNEDKEKLKAILGNLEKELLSKLDIEGTFKIDIPEGEFYVIKDLGDGNYLSIDNHGRVFRMIHDPYKVEKIFNNKDAFFDALKSGKFVMEK